MGRSKAASSVSASARAAFALVAAVVLALLACAAPRAFGGAAYAAGDFAAGSIGMTVQSDGDASGEQASPTPWSTGTPVEGLSGHAGGVDWAINQETDGTHTLVVTKGAAGEFGGESYDAGEMPGFSGSADVPWLSQAKAAGVETIDRIEVRDGVTSIGARCFSANAGTGTEWRALLAKTSSVRLASSVSSIAGFAFGDVGYGNVGADNKVLYSLELDSVYKDSLGTWRAYEGTSLKLGAGKGNTAANYPFRISATMLEGDHVGSYIAMDGEPAIHVPETEGMEAKYGEGKTGTDNAFIASGNGTAVNYLDPVKPGNASKWGLELSLADADGNAIELEDGAASVSVAKGSLKLSYAVSASGTPDVTYESSDSSVVSVTKNDDGTATLSLLKATGGEGVTITASAAGTDDVLADSATITLVVSKATHEITATTPVLSTAVGQTLNAADVRSSLGITSTSGAEDLTWSYNVGFAADNYISSDTDGYISSPARFTSMNYTFKAVANEDSGVKIQFFAGSDVYETAVLDVPVIIAKGTTGYKGPETINLKEGDVYSPPGEKSVKTFIPYAAADNVTVTTDNEDVAVINDEGQIVAVGNGTAKLLYSWSGDENVEDSDGTVEGATITVSGAPPFKFSLNAAEQVKETTVTMGRNDDDSWKTLDVYELTGNPWGVDYSFSSSDEALATVEKVENPVEGGPVAKVTLKGGLEGLGTVSIRAATEAKGDYTAGTFSVRITTKGKERYIGFGPDVTMKELSESEGRFVPIEAIDFSKTYWALSYSLDKVYAPGGVKFDLAAYDEAGLIPEDGDGCLVYNPADSYTGMGNHADWNILWDTPYQQWNVGQVNIGDSYNTSKSGKGTFVRVTGRVIFVSSPACERGGQVYDKVSFQMPYECTWGEASIEAQDDSIDLTYNGGSKNLGVVYVDADNDSTAGDRNDSTYDSKPTVTYTSADESVATVDDQGNVTPVKVGRTTVTAHADECWNFKATDVEVTVVVWDLDVKATYDKIAGIGAVTLDSLQAIEEAEAAYDALSPEQKLQVTNYDILQLARSAYDAKAADKAAADPVADAIAKLPEAGSATAADKEAADAAKAAYDALTDEQKALVGDDAKAKLDAVVEAADKAKKDADQKAADEKKAAEAKAAAEKAAAELAAASTVNKAKVTAADVKKASDLGATTITLGPKVKKVAKGAFKGTKINTVIVKTKKLKKKSVKGSLKGSKVKTVKVQIGKKKVNKKFVKKYKKIFTKKVAGKKAKVK